MQALAPVEVPVQQDIDRLGWVQVQCGVCVQDVDRRGDRGLIEVIVRDEQRVERLKVPVTRVLVAGDQVRTQSQAGRQRPSALRDAMIRLKRPSVDLPGPEGPPLIGELIVVVEGAVPAKQPDAPAAPLLPPGPAVIQ